MAINILIKIGTNCLLLGSAFEPVDLAVVIVILEHYNGGDINSNLNGRRVVMKCRDLSVPNMSRRDTLKFFRKRTECSCLKAMHLEARKTPPKLGMFRSVRCLWFVVNARLLSTVQGNVILQIGRGTSAIVTSISMLRSSVQ